MKPIFWIQEICDADWRERVVNTAETKGLKDWFASKTIEEALKSYEIRLSEG
jgi:hypothetical protein